MADQVQPQPEQVQGLTVCALCNQELLETQPKMQLHCFHVYHTNCMLTQVVNDTIEFCAVCQSHILPELPVLNARQRTPVERNLSQIYQPILNTFDTNREFKKDLKDYLRLKRLCGQKKRAVIKTAKEKKQEIAGTVDSLKEQMRNILKVSRRQLMQAPSIKQFRGACFRKNLLKSKLEKKYKYSMKDIRAALSTKPGFRRWDSEKWYNYDLGHIIRRSFYRRYVRI